VLGDPTAAAWAEDLRLARQLHGRFLDPTWQRIVLSRVDALVDAGFDGASLDRVDAYAT
jgi:endo-alpha-1,4-polygalactosaminidase (GH114 family)